MNNLAHKIKKIPLVILKIIGFIFIKKLFFRVKEYNKQKHKGKSYILCPNHTSDGDGPIFWASHQNIRIMAKKQCFKNKIFGAFLKSINVVPVNRGSTTSQALAIKQAVKYLNNAKEPSVYLMFPQGTISDINKNTVKMVKDGAFKIAKCTKRPIIPVFIEQPQPFKKCRIVYGNEIWIEDNNIDNQNQKIKKEELNKYKEILLQSILELQEEAKKLEKRPLNKLKLSEVHRNNNR